MPSKSRTPAKPERPAVRPSEAHPKAAEGESTLAPRHQLVTFGCDLRTSSLAELEGAHRRAAPESVAETFDREPVLTELGVLRTCHRLEFYVWTRDPVRAREALAPLLGAPEAWGTRLEGPGVLHLFRVAAGLESMAIGEREVRDQVRSASSSVLSRSPRGVLAPLMRRAVECAEAAAPTVPPSRSIAALAVTRILAETPRPFPRVLVVGSGSVGRGISELLAPYGRVTIVYRSRPPDAAFLRATDSRAVPWESLVDELALADVVVTATKAGGRVIGPGMLAGRRGPLVLIDLGLPRNIDPSLREWDGIRLIDLAALDSRAPERGFADLAAAVARSAGEAAEEVAHLGFETWIDGYRRDAERLRAELLAEVRPELRELSDAEWAAIERVSRRLVGRLLDGPTERLRSIPPGAVGEERRGWALDLLRTAARES